MVKYMVSTIGKSIKVMLNLAEKAVIYQSYCIS